MLPRGGGPVAIASGLFYAWRRLVTSALTAVAGGARGVGARVAHLGSSAAQVDRGTLELVAGAGAILLGIVLDIAIGPPGTQMDAIGAGLSTIAWALARLLLLRLVEPDVRETGRAWRLSLFPWAFGVTPELRAAAWVASGIVAAVTLRAAGLPTRRWLRATVVVWGVQAALSLAIVVVRWVALLALS